MKMTIHSFVIMENWRSLLGGQVEAHQGIDKHPLRLFYGVDNMAQPVFFLITGMKPDPPLFSNLVRVDRRERREQGEWSIVLTLQNPQYTDSFIALCLELVRMSAAGDSATSALELFYRALNQWRQLFARRPAKVLSPEEQRGLIAELWFADFLARTSLEVDRAVASWQGPMGAVQDFLLPTGELIEIKANHIEARGVTISSIEQLDPRSHSPLYLVVIGLELGAPDDSEGYSIAQLVSGLFDLASNDEDATVGLEDRISRLRILDSYASYDKKYALTTVNTYHVLEGFPRIKRDAAPLGVDQVNYRLLLSAATDFRNDSFGIDRN
jgi:hypothetical protein